MFNGNQYTLLDAPPSDPQAHPRLHDGDGTNPSGVPIFDPPAAGNCGQWTDFTWSHGEITNRPNERLQFLNDLQTRPTELEGEYLSIQPHLPSTQTMIENQRFPTAYLFGDNVYSSVELVGSCHNQSRHVASNSHISPHFPGRDASDNLCESGTPWPADKIGNAPGAIHHVSWSTRGQGVSSSVHWVGESELVPDVHPSAWTALEEPAHYPSPTWSTTASTTTDPSTISANGDARLARKRVTDGVRGREQTEARARLRVLFPTYKRSNEVTHTAIKVIMYLITTGDVPESMTTVEDWWKLERGVEERTSDTLNPGLNRPAETRATPASLSEAARKARQKELKKTADRIRNATLKSLEKELCALFSPCTILEALQRASDYLAFVKKTRLGGIPTSSTHWHGSWADHTGPFFTDA